MDLQSEFDRVRDMFHTLANWDELVQEKRLDAVWGHSMGICNTKVQTTLKIDRMENAIIEADDLEERRAQLFNKYWTDKEALQDLIQKYAKVDDWTPLMRYIIGCELDAIPLRGKQKNPLNVVRSAIKRLQKTFDFEEEVAKQPQGVQRVIRGETPKCKKCSEGYIKYTKEEPDRFIFVCSGCGRRIKADKIGFNTKLHA